jgi:2-amino-4-hydroxy-6-hydroxymethyldihydropteridine diphosphokinase
MAESFVAMGANLGDAHGALRTAAQRVARLAGTRLARLSRIYRSAPVGPAGQPDYLNAVAALETAMPPGELLAALQAIETAAGRHRGERWGPRTLDLDILLHGDANIDTPTLTIPHPRIAERNFVLVPLIDVAGENYRLEGRTLAGWLRVAPPNELTATELAWDEGTVRGGQPAQQGGMAVGE